MRVYEAIVIFITFLILTFALISRWSYTDTKIDELKSENFILNQRIERMEDMNMKNGLWVSGWSAPLRWEYEFYDANERWGTLVE